MELQDFVEIDNGLGKFEGETGLTNWFWQWTINGDGDDFGPVWDGIVYTLFTVNAEEANAFPDEVKIGDTVVIWEDSQGFVNMVAFATRDQALKFIPCH
tara:strand:+ start:1143 stop:1439 length:297 start_codon:yes stop_codon:yes gene_type:complete